MTKIILLILCVMSRSGCALDLAWCEPLSPSELNTNSTHYNGQIITVQGYAILTPEGHVLYESRKLHDEFSRGIDVGGRFDANKYEKYCLTIANPDLLYKNRSEFAGKNIVVKGKFVDDYLDAQHIDLGACPLPTAIIIDQADLKQRYHLP